METTIHDAMAAAGLHPHKPIDIPATGKITRFRLAGDKSGSKNGWAVLNGGIEPFGSFGSWKTGESHSWHTEPPEPPTPAERAATEQRIAGIRQTVAQEREAVQAAAAAKAQRLWRTARPAPHSHPYLVKKNVSSYGLRLLRNALLVPARTPDGVLTTLQFIDQDGIKRFLTGGRISGCYCAIGRMGNTLLLAEGFATAATLHQATGHAAAACFSCGNLLAVARAMRDKYPHIQLIVCADNDRHTPGNPGLTKATEAARAVGALLAVPFERGSPCPI